MVAHFGVLAGFHLDEGRVDKVGEPPGDFGFSHAGGTDHDDVFGCDFARKGFLQLLPPPAIAHGHGNGPLGGVLANDVAIEFCDNLTRGEVSHEAT